MKITDVKLRAADSSKYPDLAYIVALTFDNELIINDIKVYRDGKDINLLFPNSENAKQNNQFSIYADERFYKEIKDAVLEQIDSLL